MEFENELAARLAKLQKKKAHKDKMDEIKATKQAEIDAAEKIRLEEARKLKEQEDLEKTRLLEVEKEKRRLAGDLIKLYTVCKLLIILYVHNTFF